MMPEPTFERGDYVHKISGSWWEGYVVGDYSTEQTEDGVAVQLPIKNGPVQIYPASALELTEPGNVCLDLRTALAKAGNDALERAKHAVRKSADVGSAGFCLMGPAAILHRAVNAIEALKKETPNAE